MNMYSNYYTNQNYGQLYGVQPMPQMNRRNYAQRDNLEMSLKTLWMGNIDNTMDEFFIKNAFNTFGINVDVKIIRNKDNRLPLGYGFVTFDDIYTAQEVLRELNGKNIPNLNDKQFYLKQANRNGRYSVFVGNLPAEMNDEELMNFFLFYFPSVSSAKVIMNDGISKKYGFVSFKNPTDYYNALQSNSLMLGQNQISVGKARNKSRMTPNGANQRQYQNNHYY